MTFIYAANNSSGIQRICADVFKYRGAKNVQTLRYIKLVCVRDLRACFKPRLMLFYFPCINRIHMICVAIVVDNFRFCLRSEKYFPACNYGNEISSYFQIEYLDFNLVFVPPGGKLIVFFYQTILRKAY